MDTIKKIYTFENIDCPNCAAKIEAAIAKADGIEEASLNYAAGTLHVKASSAEGLLDKIQAAADSVEERAVFREKGHHHVKKVYTFENIDCPNCGAKIEAAIAKADGIEEASLNYAAGTLHVKASSAEGLLDKIQAAADSVEEGAVFREKGHHHAHEHHHHDHAHHHHDGECCCGHDHAHEHHHEHDHAHDHHHEHEHDHHHEHEHDHHHEHDHAPARTHSKTIDIDRLTLLVGGALFVVGMILHLGFPALGIASKILLLAAYLVLGWEVLVSSVKSIGKGNVFDENFLMSIATIGALCIGSWEEAAGVMLFFRVGELFEHLAVERSRRSVMDAIDLRPETVQLITEHGTETVPADEIVPGEHILVRVGDRIPLDGIVVKGESTLDTSAVTGEPVPVAVRPGDAVMSGCIDQTGVLELEVTAALQDSMVQRILDSVENAAAGKPHIDRFITRFARIYTPAVVAIAVLTAIVPSLITGNWSYWIYAALNFLMISCPCALVLSVPLAFFSGIGAGSVKGILFKDGLALEALAKVRAVVMDKTGTLTQGTFSVTSVVTDGDAAETVQMAAACERVSTHPIGLSILAYAKAQAIAVPEATDVQEIAGKGISGTVDGRRVLCGNAKLLTEAGISVPEGPAGTVVYVAADGRYMGYLVLSDTIKPRAKETIAALRRRGLYTVMLTGDTEAHTRAVADELGIDEAHAALLPTDKPDRMEQVRKAHGAVYFIGDGINDAPVISGADVGAAMGSGADAAMEAADVVLLRTDPQAVLTSIEIADRVNKTARFCVIFALAVKLAVMIGAFLGFANMWLSVFADTGVTILCVLIVLFRVHFYYRKK